MNGQPKIVFIGSGQVASSMAMAFREKGCIVSQVFSRDINHADTLANAVGAHAVNNLNTIEADADLYIVAVRDNALPEINAGLMLPGRLVVHTSGAAPVDALALVSLLGGAFYPLQTFTKGRKLDWQNLPIVINGMDEHSTSLLKECASRIGGRVYEFDETERKRIHLAAVMANNFVNYLLGEAKKTLGEHIPFDILEPLVRETIDKAFNHDVDSAQTGPARRNDLKTIAAHLKMLDSSPETQGIYAVLTEAIMEKYQGK